MANEIKFYLSGGAGNTNPFLSNGGAMSVTEIVNGLLNNLWPDVSESDSQAGITDHKVIYIKNVSGAALTEMRAYFGEIDQHVGMAITAATAKNISAPLLAAATDPVTQYYQVWQNITESPASTVNLNNTNKRVVLKIGSSAHPVYNQYPDQVEILMAKTGAPTGTATIKVWTGTNSATDNTVVRTLGTIDVSTLTTTMTKKTFNTVTDLISNPLPGIAWRIGIEYTGGTASAHVDIAQTTQTATNNLGCFTQSWDGAKWVDFATNWPCMNIWTNHGPCFQSGTPPPPGSGSPPPGQCGATPLAAGIFPATGGGGGSQQHGYDIKSAADNGNDGNVAANAIDRSLTTRWSQNSTNAQLTLDMGAINVVDHFKIAWYKGDQRVAKFNLQYSTDNSTWTNILSGSGAQWQSSGKSADLEEIGLVNMSGVSASVVGGVATAIIQTYLPVSWNGADVFNDCESTITHELMEMFTEPAAQKSYEFDSPEQIGWVTSDGNPFGGEVSDICEFLPNDVYKDGLQCNPYWDIATSKCVTKGVKSQSPGKDSSGTTIKVVGFRNQDGITTPPTPIVWLIFWGTSWGSGANATFRQNLVNDIQNKLLGTDKQFWDPGVAAYGFGMPKWGGYIILNAADAQPADTGNVTQQDLEHAFDVAIRTGQVSAPSSSTYLSLNIRVSNVQYNIVSDRNWTMGDDFAGALGFHYSLINTMTVPDPAPPPPPPPPPTDPPSPPPDPAPVPPTPTAPMGSINARYIRYIGLGNSQDNWNSVTEFEIYGSGSSQCPTPSPPPGGGGTPCVAGTNPSKPTSFATGLCVPDLNSGEYIAITLERVIPAHTEHVEVDNYSIVISNDANVQPPVDEPIPIGPDGNPVGGGTVPVPSPPGVFDPGTIPPVEPIPPPPPIDTTPPPPTGEPPPSPPTGGVGGTTPGGVNLVALPSGYTYGEHHTNFKENFQSNGSFRLDCGAQPQLNQLNLSFALNLSSGSDEISSKLSGGTHTDSKAKNGRCYDIGLAQAGNRVRIRKEDPHPSYHDGPSHSINLGSLNGKWVYVQSLKWNEGKNCHLQCWIDTSGSETPANHFTKILDDIDTGGWFESPYLTCYDSSDSQTTIRVDSMSTSKFHYRNCCATRINGG